MANPERIARALGALRQSISYENATTSREERIEIMRAGAEAMASSGPSTEQDVDYLLEFVPPGVRMQIERDFQSGEVSCDLFKRQDENLKVWRGGGATIVESIEEALRQMTRFAAVNCMAGTPPNQEAKPRPPAPGRPTGKATECEVRGRKFESKAGAIRWLLENEETKRWSDFDLANLVPCSEGYVKQTRIKLRGGDQ